MSTENQFTATAPQSQPLIYNVPKSWHDEYAARRADMIERAKTDPVVAWTLYLESDECSAICRGFEVERLEEAGEIIGGLS